MAQSQTNSVRSEISVGYYVVGLVDILNQRQALQGWSELPSDGKLDERHIKALRETIGTVGVVRDTLINFFDGFAQSGTESGERVEVLGKPELREWFEAHLSTFCFADTVVGYSPLTARAGMVPIRDVLGLFIAIAFTLPWCLAGGVAIRGAINVGAGSNAFESQIYGPVLASVHHLESEVAGYPRIVVGAELQRFIATVRDDKSQPNHSMLAELAKLMADCTYRDTDGVWVIDYLAEPFRKLESFSGYSGTRTHLTEAYGFICREHDRFESSKNVKLAGRYSQLRTYWESRLPDWGIPIIPA